MGTYLRGDLGRADRSFADAISYGVPAGQWLTTNSALGYRSLIAGDLGRRDDQRVLARRAVDMADERGINSLTGVARVALGVSLAADGRPAEALTPLQQGVTAMAARGQPPELAGAMICLERSPSDRRHRRLALTIKQARSMIDFCPDPGAVGDRLAALEQRRPRRAVQHGDDLTDRELKILRLLTSSSAESDIADRLFVSFNTVHTHVRSMYQIGGELADSRRDTPGPRACWNWISPR